MLGTFISPLGMPARSIASPPILAGAAVAQEVLQTYDAEAAGDGLSEDGRRVSSGEALVRKLVGGGWTMLVLLLVSIVGVAVMIDRMIRLRLGVFTPSRLAEEMNKLWEAKRYRELCDAAKGSDSTLGRIAVAMVQHRGSSYHDLNNIAGDIASRDLRRHLQKAYPLLVVATISPLLGLLGTVIGMVGAFSTIEALGDLADPAAFGGDISKALITTSAGLVVAIPALAAYHFFKSRTLAMGVELEEVASELLLTWFVERKGVAEIGQSSPAKSDNGSETVAAGPRQEQAHAD